MTSHESDKYKGRFGFGAGGGVKVLISPGQSIKKIPGERRAEKKRG